MEIWGLIGSLVGVILGWALTQSSTWLNTRQADRRVIKEALYALLQLHHLLAVLQRLTGWLPTLATTLRKQIPAELPPEYTAAADELLAQIMHTATLPLFGERLAELQAEYVAALLKLAPVDPVSAHRLRGQQNVLAHLPQVGDHWRQAMITHLGQAPTLPAGALAHMQQQLLPQQLADTYELVRDVVQQLVSQLDRRTRRRVAAVLAAPADEADLLTEMEQQMQQVMAGLAHLVPPVGT